MPSSDAWVKKVEQKMEQFARTHRAAYSVSERQVSASFEIGCFLSLVDFYENKGYEPEACDLVDGRYRYLTSPTGNPDNFSYVALRHETGTFELRQQVRIQSSIHEDICFTPDLAVIQAGADVGGKKDKDYAGGKRRFFSVDTADVVSIHECKSMNPFPELLVSFLGMLVVTHPWLSAPTDRSALDPEGIHLAPSLFVGGDARPLHFRMVNAIESSFPVNIVVGLHAGTWSLHDKERKLNLLSSAASMPSKKRPRVVRIKANRKAVGKARLVSEDEIPF
jgi:hypothetical protein